MSNHISSDNSDLLMDLSEEEQQIVTGGISLNDFAYFFFQQTAIESFADDQTTFSVNGGNSKVSSSSKTGYKSFQTTFAFALPGFGKSRSRRRTNMSLRRLFRLLNNWDF